MTKNSIGFHTGLGGNHGGIGEWMAADAGNRSSIKSIDDYGKCLEALEKGVPFVGYRMSAPAKIPVEVPDYTLSPPNAAVTFSNMLMVALPPEFDNRTWLEPINEPRAKLAPGDVQWQGMNPVLWLSEFSIEMCKILNPQGYRLCLPSFNTGEPPEEDYRHMEGYVKYCADNPGMAALSVHEYSFEWNDRWDEIYPYHYGRFERFIALADEAGIPRDFNIFVTEWGGSHDWAHDWDWVKKWTDKYNEIIVRFPQVKMVAAWCLQNYQGAPISNQVQTWIRPFHDGSYEDDFDPGQQPATTFLGTLPGDTTPPPTDPPPGSDCPGTINIRRVYNLLPQDTTIVELATVAGELHQLRNTFGYSHDDAITLVTHGNEKSEMFVYEPQRRNRGDLEEIEDSGARWKAAYFKARPPADKPPNRPPGGATLNIRKYFEPVGDIGQQVVFRFTDGRTQAQQLRRQADGSCVLWKGEGQWFDGKQYVDYEHWRVQDGQVQKFIDTSDAGNGGRDAYNLHWTAWLPEVVTIGQQYTSTPTVTRFNRTNCQVVDDSSTVDYLTVVEVLPRWVSKWDKDIVYEDVMVVEWRKSQNGAVIETYKFAPGVAYVAWNDGEVGEIPLGREPLTGKLTVCYNI